MVINKSVNKLWALFSAFKNPWWAGCRDEFPQVDSYFDHLHLWRWEKLRFSIKTAKLAFAVPEAAGAYVTKYAIENKLKIDLFALNPFLNTLISDVCTPRMSS